MTLIISDVEEITSNNIYEDEKAISTQMSAVEVLIDSVKKMFKLKFKNFTTKIAKQPVLIVKTGTDGGSKIIKNITLPEPVDM